MYEVVSTSANIRSRRSPIGGRMAGSRNEPIQLQIVQLLERIGKVARQHVPL
jgi:hypothetical protein